VVDSYDGRVEPHEPVVRREHSLRRQDRVRAGARQQRANGDRSSRTRSTTVGRSTTATATPALGPYASQRSATIHPDTGASAKRRESTRPTASARTPARTGTASRSAGPACSRATRTPPRRSRARISPSRSRRSARSHRQRPLPPRLDQTRHLSGGWTSVLTKPGRTRCNSTARSWSSRSCRARRRSACWRPRGAIVAGSTYHIVGTYDGNTQRPLYQRLASRVGALSRWHHRQQQRLEHRRGTAARSSSTARSMRSRCIPSRSRTQVGIHYADGIQAPARQSQLSVERVVPGRQRDLSAGGIDCGNELFHRVLHRVRASRSPPPRSAGSTSPAGPVVDAAAPEPAHSPTTPTPR
jgi:hypothetical protein